MASIMTNATAPRLYARLSDEQKAVADRVKQCMTAGLSKQSNYLVRVDARAGCGKTTTALATVQEVLAMRQVPSTGWRIGVFVFNAPIAKEITEKVNGLISLETSRNSSVSVRTMHSQGMEILKTGLVRRGVKYNQMFLENGKARTMAELAFDEDKDRMRVYRLRKRDWTRGLSIAYTQFRMAVGKRFSSSFHATQALSECGWLDRYPELKDDVLALFHEHLKLLVVRGTEMVVGPVDRSVDPPQYIRPDKSTFDFEDCINLPARGVVPTTQAHKFHLVIVDEAQDSSQSRIQMAYRMLLPGGTIMYVGDPAQSIYGFAGASPYAMDDFEAYAATAQTWDKRPFETHKLTISTTYRCPQSVVTACAKYAPGFVAGKDNPAGEFGAHDYQEFLELASKPEFGNESTYVLCRTAGPLVQLFAKYGKNPTWKLLLDWSGIIDQIKALSQYPDGGRIDGVLQDRLTTESLKPEAKQNDTLIERLEESLAIWQVMFEHSDQETLAAMYRHATGIADEAKRNSGVTLMTSHKAKGKEADHVYLIAENLLMPSKRARTAEAKQQELNLIYVSYTRAKKTFTSVVCSAEDLGRKETK